ncbi:MAG: hypothetical protein KDA45_15515 [Planctomycetales bacterium]|nr:hypothetical protein [Planctomycetales bacterium]
MSTANLIATPLVAGSGTPCPMADTPHNARVCGRRLVFLGFKPQMQSIERVLIVGAGWVGRQVAARMAGYGIEVWLVDRDEKACQAALTWLRELDATEPPQPEDAGDWLSRVHTGNSLSELAAEHGPHAADAFDLVLESVPEQISLKKRVLREASRCFPPPTIIASNSSYFVPSMLSAFVQQPSRFAHLHFHVPVLVDSVVDVVGCAETKPQVIELLRQLTLRIGQEPLLLRREHPGYIFNWLLQAVLRAALELVALDVTDARQVDKSWTAVTGMPLGPFGIMDRIGLDVIEQVLSNARWSAPPEATLEQLLAILADHTRRGELGVKSNRGFYDYKDSQ